MALLHAGSGSMIWPRRSFMPRLQPSGSPTSALNTPAAGWYSWPVLPFSRSGEHCIWFFTSGGQRYRARTSFGVTQVTPVIDPLAEIIPPGVDAAPGRRPFARPMPCWSPC